ncbi:hypothetical protein MHK_009983, partial [Candidatus Magnetomorum sp. HK-1]
SYPYQAYSLSTTRALSSPVTINSVNIDFNLITGSHIRGRVTNNNNAMLYGVMIYAKSDITGIQSSTITNEVGQYTLSNLAYATDYIVYADSTDYPIQYYSLSDTRADAKAVNLNYGTVNNINFILDKGAVIHGNVRINDSTTSAGQGIMVNISSNSLDTGHTVPTDANGVFEIAGLDAAASD